MVYKPIDKQTSGGAIKSMPNQQLSNELHKTNYQKILEKKSLFFN